jgi:hypothetical protein
MFIRRRMVVAVPRANAKGPTLLAIFASREQLADQFGAVAEAPGLGRSRGTEVGYGSVAPIPLAPRPRQSVAVEAFQVEIGRALKPRCTGPTPMRSTSSAGDPDRGVGPGRLTPAQRSALNQALAKALAFRDAGKMQEAREWEAELVRLMKAHDLLA